MDRCALFVDAGYVLADGAMAVHGTSIRESVSWDYAGLLQFFANLSTDRTGQQLLRCYWYEATADGRRSPEHDTLADLPGLMLRLGRMRPGKREGVETEIHRDLTTLARNRAVSDVLLVSADEDLAQVVADVQDLGVRVIIVHISVDGNWTVSRSLRQQCDDIVEIDGTQLRPYVELIAGAEPARYSEQYAAGGYGGKPMSNGHSAGAGGSGSHAALGSGSTGAHPAPPAIYTAPVVADYQPPPQAALDYPAPAQPAPDYHPPAQPGSEYPAPAQPAPDYHPPAQPGSEYPAPAQPAPDYHPPAQPPADYQAPAKLPDPVQAAPAQPDPAGGSPGEPATGRGLHRALPSGNQPPARQSPGPQDGQSGPQRGQPPGPQRGQPSGPQRAQPAPPLYATQGADMFREPAGSGPAPGSAAGAQARNAAPQGASSSGPAAAPPTSAPRANGGSPPYAPSHQGGYAEQAASQFSSAPPEQFSSAPPSLPARRTAQPNGLHGNGSAAQRGPQTPRSQPGSRSHQAPRSAAAPSGGHIPQQVGYGQLPGGSLAGAASPGGSMADTVQAAHSEGFDFGESVAREAPALWLEAVLARKPRMPSDLEARLLQGSALPIDSLLHDEVRQALRRGFWDALERSRR